ncbi:MAG TPA: hypothetical protein VFQ51_03670, partial [Vicinamibacteria bacterium]|nr:hypothetical protein [Vicinamibacteria bacterium]
RKQRDDVDRELSDDLRAQVEEKEAELGRRLTEDETAAILKGVGHPLTLALRYQQGRYLIGPEVYPLFLIAVKSILGALAVFHVLLPATYFVLNGEPSRRVIGLFLRFPGVAMPVLAWTTIAFVILDTRTVRSAVERSLAGWRPQSLPEVAKTQEAVEPPSASGLAWTAFLSVWWLAGIAYPPLILGPAAAQVDLGPVFQRLYVPIAASAVVSVAVGWLRLSHPGWTRVAVYGGMAADTLALVVLYLLAGSDVFVIPAAGAEPALTSSLNHAIRLAMQVSFLATLAAVVWKYVKYFRAR